MDDKPTSIVLDERIVVQWLTEADRKFKDLESRASIYSDSEDFSAKEFDSLCAGRLSDRKRFDSVIENNRTMYSLILEILEQGAKMVYVMDLYKQLFPNSPVANDPKVQGFAEYAKNRCEGWKPILLERLCFRDEIMKDMRGEL
jgi:hypothetical protein